MTRDTGIRDIRARQNHTCYGMGLGIIILDDVYPGFPGDVRNASAWPFPVQYDIVQSVDIDKLVDNPDVDKDTLLQPIIESARRLERMGCRAIAAECGFFAYYQRDIAAAVNVPVFMSSLLQVPWAQQLVGPEKIVGILTGAPEGLTAKHLGAVGIASGSNVEIFDTYERCGADVAEFRKLWSTTGLRSNPPGANYEKAERELVTAACSILKDRPQLGALVLECTGYPPFARAIQHAIDVPVFSWGTLLDYAFSVAAHRDYYGHV